MTSTTVGAAARTPSLKPAVRPPRRAALAGAALGSVTFVAYLPGLGRSLDFDSVETVGLFIRPGPPWGAFQRQAVFNNHPAFSFLEQLVRVVTGRTDAATMRVLPILCGALAVGLLTWFAGRRYGLLAGVVAGTVVAANPTFVSLSRAVRGYSLLALCALASTLLVVSDDGRRSRFRGPAYVVVTAVGMATHLYMVPVVAAHVGLLAARRSLHRTWVRCVLAVLLLSLLAYAGMAREMVDAAGAHSRVFQVDLPWRVARMAAGGGWAAVLLAPLLVVGAFLTFRGRGARGAVLAAGVVLFGLWAVMQSTALTERFFVWLVPAAGWLAAIAVARRPALAVLAAGAVVLAAASIPSGYTADLSGYRLATGVIRQANAKGERSCVVGVGVPPMLGYLDSPRDFAPVTHPDELDRCDLVVVASWWSGSTAPWFAADQAVIDAAEATFPHRRVLGEMGRDPALALSRQPIRQPLP